MPLKTATLRTLPAVLWWATPAALVLLAVTLLAVHRAGGLPVEKMRAGLSDALSPVMSAVAAPFSAAFQSIDSVKIATDLKTDNIRLREENARLRQWYETALKLQAENVSLRELLNVKADPSMSFVTARVIADAGGAFVKSVLVPVGGSDRVEKGAAVLSGHGLMGRVTEVGQSSARILLVTDLNSRIPVLVQGTRIKAILAGKNRDVLRLERLPPDSGVALGDRIVTSGDGAQLPAEIPIGTVVAMDGDGVWVRPFSDIARTTHVQIINTDLYHGMTFDEFSGALPAPGHRKK